MTLLRFTQHVVTAMNELTPRQVKITDAFWSPRLTVNATQAIVHQWRELEKSGCLDNFRLLAGDKEGFREGWFFADSDAFKWLDAAARIYVLTPDAQLKALMDTAIDLCTRAQSPDGYLFTYNQLHFPGQRWIDLQVEHELYCHGHLIEAGVSHYEATGETAVLNIAVKAADLLVREFLNAGPEKTCGHEEIELALLRLYHVTHTEDYLELARQFLERRGHISFFPIKLAREFSDSGARKKIVRQQQQAYATAHPEYAISKLPPDNFAKKTRFSTARWYVNALSGRYAQQHAPIRRHTKPVGHAVRFGYLETAVALLHRLRPDDTLLPALERTWQHMIERRMYVTGGLGAIPGLEGFGRDYELDPEFAYAETCAALASLFWNWEMALITQQARYSDLFEWQLYNAASVGMGLNGENYLYNNPLTCRRGITRRPWFAVPCCPSNLSRMWASLGKYIYSFDRDNVWIHQYIGSETTIDLAVPIGLSIESGLPFTGTITVSVNPTNPIDFTLHLRIPSWAADHPLAIKINGQEQSLPAVDRSSVEPTAQGYDPRSSRFIPIKRTWRSGDVIEVTFEMPIVLRRVHPRVKGHAGKVALTRGPLVYCLESIDNPNVDIFTARLDPSKLRAEYRNNLLGGTMVLTDQSLTFIPYHLWANRGESQMTVWVNA
jgi:uncharacterized protein